MARWLRVLRGMLGTGLTFSVGVGLVGSLVGAVRWVLSGGAATVEQMADMAMLIVGSSAWAFPIGVAFSGFLALTARGRSFHDLSLPRFAALGAGGGLLLYGLMALGAWDAWSVRTAMVNATLLVGLGAGSATATLVLARRSRAELTSGDDPPGLAEPEIEPSALSAGGGET